MGSANFLAARILRKVLASVQWEFLVRQDLKDGKAKVPLDGQLLVSNPILKVIWICSDIGLGTCSDFLLQEVLLFASMIDKEMISGCCLVSVARVE